MNISVTCRHMEVTDSLRDHAFAKVSEALKDFPRVESVHVIMDVQKHLHIAEVVVQGSSHIRLEADETSTDMYNSIDVAVEKVAKQLRKNRDKVQDHKGKHLGELEVDVEFKE